MKDHCGVGFLEILASKRPTKHFDSLCSNIKRVNSEHSQPYNYSSFISQCSTNQHLIHLPRPRVRLPIKQRPDTARRKAPESISIMSLTNCRFYEEKYPEIDSFVMVNVKQVWSLGPDKRTVISES
jgi:hypothetical protein